MRWLLVKVRPTRLEEEAEGVAASPGTVEPAAARPAQSAISEPQVDSRRVAYPAVPMTRSGDPVPELTSMLIVSLGTSQA